MTGTVSTLPRQGVDVPEDANPASSTDSPWLFARSVWGGEWVRQNAPYLRGFANREIALFSGETTGLAEALEPFATCCDNHFHDASILDQFDDNVSVLWLIQEGKLSPTGISVGDLKRVRALLAHSDAAPDAVGEIAAERRRQMEVEGWTPRHDDGHADGSMAVAGALYALSAGTASKFVANGSIDPEKIDGSVAQCPPPDGWPWGPRWWKPTGRRRDLIKAGALIVAEIERLDRAALARAETSQGQGGQDNG